MHSDVTVLSDRIRHRVRHLTVPCGTVRLRVRTPTTRCAVPYRAASDPEVKEPLQYTVNGCSVQRSSDTQTHTNVRRTSKCACMATECWRFGLSVTVRDTW